MTLFPAPTLYTGSFALPKTEFWVSFLENSSDFSSGSGWQLHCWDGLYLALNRLSICQVRENSFNHCFRPGWKEVPDRKLSFLVLSTTWCFVLTNLTFVTISKNSRRYTQGCV
jgi:hypothetical protein